MDDINALNVRLLQEAYGVFNHRVQEPQLLCRIYDAYAGPKQKNHNCLGCNFNDLTKQFADYLKVAASGVFDLHHGISMYAFLGNAIWERINDIFDVVSVPDGYRARHYSPFVRIRRWANFFKHPKEFGWLVHHALYTIGGTENGASLLGNPECVYVDDEFLKKYYSAERVKGLAKEFNGKECNIIVLLPNVAELTEAICVCLADFVNVVTQNPVYFELLNDKTTVIDFFDRATDDLEVVEARIEREAERVKKSS